MIVSAILITLFIILCIYMISEGINHDLEKELVNQKEINKQLISLLQNEKSRTDTLYKIVFHIRNQLSLLKLKNCPEEEFRNIPFEIIEWIDLLEKTSKEDDNGVHK